MQDLAPHIFRKRLVIEGTRTGFLAESDLVDYLAKLAPALDMVGLTDPVTHKSDRYGWAGWIHWETSGCHVYAWDEEPAFFSVDIYTCKDFRTQKALDLTTELWTPDHMVCREF